MGILLGLLTAVFWGGSDFVARFAARKIGALRTSLYMQIAGFFLLCISLPWMGGWGHLFDGSGWQPWAWGVVAGVLNCAATLALYRSFEIGKMAVVAPLSASYPALTVALSLFTGEHLTRDRLAGMAFVVAGAALVAAAEQPQANATTNVTGETQTVPAAHPPARRSGIGWALFSSIGFGFLFWLLGTRIVPAVGYAATVWMIRLTSSILTVAVILCFRQRPFVRPPGSIPLWLAGMGVLDTSAFIMNNYGMRIEQVAVVSVLSSLYGAVTVGLAAIFLRERVSRWQWLGILAVFSGIFLISR